MNYGVPYQGSKNKIAEKIIKFLPPAENFYDLFAGGCAVAQVALISGKYRNVYINDINGAITQLFVDGVAGKYSNEKRWISREDFFAQKETDAFIKFTWSFGNNGQGYMYSKEIELYKRAYHYAVFGDYSYFAEMGINVPTINSDVTKERRLELRKWIISNHAEIKEKYINWYMINVMHSAEDYNEIRKNLASKISDNSEKLRQYLIEALKDSGLTQAEDGRRLGTQMQGHYFGKSQWEFPTQKHYEKMQEFIPKLSQTYLEIYGLQELYESVQSLERLQSLQSLQSLERLERLQSLESLERLETITRYNKSYNEIEIKPNSVIYCDIPYANTNCGSYNGFNHAEFYEWARQQKSIYISEYTMPEEFESVFEIEKRCTMGKNLTVEKVFTLNNRNKLQPNLDDIDWRNQWEDNNVNQKD